MNMEVEIISTTSIAPSSPPPPHLKTYKISLLDQFQISAYITTLLFYPNSQETNTRSKRSQLLKQSLSETLSRFYPIAGKIKDKLTIDCSDNDGLCYTEAKCNISLSQYLSKPDLTILHKFMPNATEGVLPLGSPVALIQETVFACGGFTIGVYVSHMVCDGYSVALFLKDWAATARKAAVKHPFLGGEFIFPHDPVIASESNYVIRKFAPVLRKGRHMMRRIVFTESAVANLKAKVNLNDNIKNSSRVEVVTAILVKSLMTALKNKTGDNKPLRISQNMNVRGKDDEMRIPECSMGNFVRIVGATITANTKQSNEIVSKVREIMKKVDIEEFVKEMRSGEDRFFKYNKAFEEFKDSNNCPDFVAFSGLCNFGVYDIDFGLGKPIWAVFLPKNKHTPDVPFFNYVVMMDTKRGKGVEAWVCLNQDDFGSLEEDSEILQYASFDPSPIHNSSEHFSKL